ncbi:hypothetical protein [Anaerosinus sp.]
MEEVRCVKQDKALLELELSSRFGNKLAPVRYSLAAGQRIKGMLGMNRIDPWRKEKPSATAIANGK